MCESSNKISELQAQVETLKRRLTVMEKRSEEFEAFIFRKRTLRDKLQPQLWNYRQHPPRILKIPETYRSIRVPSNAPRIAIVTPSLNHSTFIRETIDSVLAQHYPNLHYWVQDGGSTDDTQVLLSEYGARIRWRSEADDGQADAINRGFDAVSGDIMAYLNSDDILLPGALAYVAQEFQRDTDIDFIYSNRIAINENGLEIARIILPPHDRAAIKWVDFIPQETMFWRRRVWDAVGPFDKSFRFALDWDFILRAGKAGMHFKRLPRFLACFRIHPSQKTSAISDIGYQEQQRLRKTNLGLDHEPSSREIHRGVSSYMTRHVIFQRLYKLGIIRLM